VEAIQHFLHSLHGEQLQDLIRWGGLVILFAFVFAETGLLVGFFLPGDSLLFSAGALVGSGLVKAPAPLPQDPLSGIIVLNLVLMAAAIMGDTTGYWFGHKTGPPLFNRPNSRLFRRDHLLKAQAFYEKHGGTTIILARWVPFVRTFAPIIAGIAGMPYRTFMMYNVVGGLSWVLVCTLLGFFLGSFAWVRENNEKVILLIVALSLLPVIAHYLKEKVAARRHPASPDGDPDALPAPLHASLNGKVARKVGQEEPITRG
jgi:membrane-associated protein